MTRALTYGILQQRSPCGFYPWFAPKDFNRASQPLDIYEVFRKYYRQNSNAKFITRYVDNFPAWGGTNNYQANETPTYVDNSIGSSFHYGYTLGGVDYTFDVGHTYYIGSYNGTYTSIEVNSTANFPSSGKILLGYVSHAIHYGGRSFVYTSKDATHFYGPAQSVTATTGGNFVHFIVQWPTGSIKRYIIANHTSSSILACQNGVYYNEWVYLGPGCWSVQLGDSGALGTTVKWVHLAYPPSITCYPYCMMYGNTQNTLEGEMTMPAPNCTYSQSFVMLNCTKITGTLRFADTFLKIQAYPTSVDSFSRMTGVTGLDLGNGMQRIETQAFNSNPNITGNLHIPASMQYICEGAFYGCKFTSITSDNPLFPVFDNVLYDISQVGKKIALHAAAGVGGNIIIQSDCTRIGAYCFYKNALKTGDLVIPNSVTSIGYGAFEQNLLLTGALTLSNSLTLIESRAFSWTQFSGNLIIPDSVVTIQSSAFDNYSITRGFEGGNLVIGSGCTSIGAYAFRNQKFGGTLTLGGASGMTIGDYAFYACIFSGTLNIPSTLGEVSSYAFVFGDATTYNLLTDITTSSSRYVVYDKVLYDTGVSGKIIALLNAGAYTGTLTLKSDTTDISAQCFYRAKRTGSLSFPSTLKVIKTYAFAECLFTGGISFPSGLTTIESYAFYNNGTRFTGSLTIPNSVTLCDSFAFFYCTGLNGTLTIGTGLTTVGYSVFRQTGFVGSVNIPNNITTIDQYAFYGCAGITEFTIPDSITTVNSASFQGCTGVTNLIFGASGTAVTQMITNKSYFTSLATISISGSNPSYAMESGCNMLFNKAETSVAWVPAKVTGDMIIPDGVTSIESLISINTFSGYFYLGSGLSDITNLYLSKKIFSSLDVSSSNANYADNSDNILYNKALTQIVYVCKPGSGTLTIGSGITAIVSEAFNACSGYDALSLPSGFDLDINSRWRFTDFSGSSLDASILNCSDGTPGSHHKILISANSLSNLLAYNPNAITDAATRYIDILTNSVVTTGLLCWLDAGDIASYPGSGNTWYDLSGNGNNGTIYGTVTFVTNKFQFNGVAGNKIIGTSPNLSASDFTVQVIARYAGSPRESIMSANRGNWLLGWYRGNINEFYAEGWVYNPSAGGDDNWHMFTGHGTVSGDKYSFYDGLTNKITDNNGGSSGPNGFTFPRYVGDSEYSNCEVAVLLMYNRRLTNAEIQENFNNYKSRYAI